MQACTQDRAKVKLGGDPLQPCGAYTPSMVHLSDWHAVDADDMRRVLAAGASAQQVEDALAICFSFDVIVRLADSFHFSVPSSEAFAAGAKYLLARGYR